MNLLNAQPPRFLRLVRSCLLPAVAFLSMALPAPAPAQSQLDTAMGATAAGRAALPVGASPGRLASGPQTDGKRLQNEAMALAAGGNPYGLSAIWVQGDWVAKACLLLLALMSVASWYALLGRFLSLRRLNRQCLAARGVFDDPQNFSTHIAQLAAGNPVRFVADAGSSAVHRYAALKPRVDYDTWLVRAIEQALSSVQIRMQGGMALLATVGSTAPFVGLFGTVWAIYSALVQIGASGQASIDRVAGPVGEALIMTAIGLAVAVPAVFGYNWLLRQNKLAFESLRSLGTQLHALLLARTDGSQAPPPSAALKLGASVVQGG